MSFQRNYAGNRETGFPLRIIGIVTQRETGFPMSQNVTFMSQNTTGRDNGCADFCGIIQKEKR
jgi:hypothetical protein